MRRTFVILTVGLLAVLLLAAPGLATGGEGQGSPSFNLYGTIKTVDCGGGAITVNTTWRGNPAEVTVALDTYTVYMFCTGFPGTGTVISCDDLGTGDLVRVIRDSDGEVATRVILYVPAED